MRYHQFMDTELLQESWEKLSRRGYTLSLPSPEVVNIITPTGFPPVQGLTLDSNRRLQQQVSVELVDGFEIGDATTLQVTDGVESVTLEFVDSSVSGNTPAPGNFPVFFTPNDDAVTVADTFRDAINSSAVQNVIAIRAASTDGTASGSSSASSIADWRTLSRSAVGFPTLNIRNCSSSPVTLRKPPCGPSTWIPMKPARANSCAGPVPGGADPPPAGWTPRSSPLIFTVAWPSVPLSGQAGLYRRAGMLLSVPAF